MSTLKFMLSVRYAVLGAKSH